jgi:hypothetical protein
VEDERAALVERPLQDVREHERALCDAFVDVGSDTARLSCHFIFS